MPMDGPGFDHRKITNFLSEFYAWKRIGTVTHHYLREISIFSPEIQRISIRDQKQYNGSFGFCEFLRDFLQKSFICSDSNNMV
jgi:hypothetical protein